MADISKIQTESATYNIKDSQARQSIANLSLPKNYFNNKKFILIGDSYAEGYTPDGTVTSWQEYFISITGLSNTIRKYQGGSGFCNISNSKTFQTLLEEVTSDNTVSDIVVLGGYNDTSYSNTQINNAIHSFQLKANEKFPNANIHIGAVGWSSDGTKIYTLNNLIAKYKMNAPLCNCHYLKNIEYSLHEYFTSFSSDGIHPNAHGQNWIAINLIQALLSGSADVQFTYTNINVTPASENITFSNLDTLGCTMNNNLIEVSVQGRPNVAFTTGINASGRNTEIELGTITSGYIIGSNYPICSIPVKIFLQATGGYFNAYGRLNIRNKKLYLNIGQINSSGNNYESYTNIIQIQLDLFHATFDSLFC